jgi:hypothetical protein
MPPDQTPGVTGSLLPGDRDDVVITNWLTTMATGDEYGGAFVFAKVRFADLWGIVVRESGEARSATDNVTEASLQSRAAAIARNVPAVETRRPAVPYLTGDLLEDARAVTGLTLDQIGRATRVSGRAVAGWRAGTVPRHREAFLQALRSIGLSLVGGLGPAGVQRWFLAGAPTRLDRLAAGDIESVATEARAYETSPAT